jgi:outer membrane protein, multidrug efflux system
MSRLLYKTLLAPALALLIIASGCMKMGPDYSRPEFEYQVPGAYKEAKKEAGPASPSDRWWEGFGDPKLNRTVEDALKRNLDVAVAAAVVLERQAAFVQTRSKRFPTVSIEGQGQNKRSVTSSIVGGETEVYNLSLAASFEVDLWGKLARAEESARADLLAAKENRHTVAQTVAASSASLYFQISAINRRLGVSHSSITARERSLTFVENRYKRGLASILDLRQARRSLAQARAQVPSLTQELGLAQQQLRVLLGHYPTISPPQKNQIDYLAKLKPVPPGLPSELLLRRPDLRSSEAGLKSLSAQIGVARAARFPAIKLTAGWGYSSASLGQLFTGTSELWNLAVGLSQPIFDAGRLKAGEEAARARYSQGVATYAKTVLNAFSEVEGALLTRRETLRRRGRLKEAVVEAIATQLAAQGRYVRGLQDYLAVLEAQQARYSLEDQLVLADLAQLTNRVTLHRALGGGWASPPPLKKAEK